LTKSSPHRRICISFDCAFKSPIVRWIVFYYVQHVHTSEALAESCGGANIRTGAAVTRVFHDGRTIAAVEVNGHERLEVDRLASPTPHS
jgi:hypothetical protein